MKWNQHILLLALLLTAGTLHAEGGGTAVADAPKVQDAAVIITDDPAVLAEAQRRVVEEATRTGTPVTRVILGGTGFETLTPQELAPLTTDGQSTAPQFAEDLADAMDADRAKQIAAYKKASRMMAVVRGYAVGGLTSVTMTVGALQTGASPQTVAASAVIGLAVGGPYSYFLQKIQQKNLDWQSTQSLLAIDPKNRPAHPYVKLVKQMVVPVTLATLMSVGKVIADQVPGVDFKTFFTDPAMLGGVGMMAVASSAFQYPWLEKNKELNNAEKAAAGTDELAIARAKYNSDRRAFTLSLSLAVSNSLQMSGLSGIGNYLAGFSNLTGNLYRALTAPKKESPTRAIASSADSAGEPHSVERKGLGARIGGACADGYAALKAVASRTLASARSR